MKQQASYIILHVSTLIVVVCGMTAIPRRAASQDMPEAEVVFEKVAALRAKLDRIHPSYTLYNMDELWSTKWRGLFDSVDSLQLAISRKTENYPPKELPTKKEVWNLPFGRPSSGYPTTVSRGCYFVRNTKRLFCGIRGVFVICAAPTAPGVQPESPPLSWMARFNKSIVVVEDAVSIQGRIEDTILISRGPVFISGVVANSLVISLDTESKHSIEFDLASIKGSVLVGKRIGGGTWKEIRAEDSTFFGETDPIKPVTTGRSIEDMNTAVYKWEKISELFK